MVLTNFQINANISKLLFVKIEQGGTQLAQSVTLVYCSQTVGRIKMKLGMQVVLGTGHIALDAEPARSPPPQERSTPKFRSIFLRLNGCIDQDATWYGGRPRPRRHCFIWGSSSPKKAAQRPPTFRPLSVVAKRSPISPTAELL